MNKLIAIIGMCGSGKTEAVNFFVKKGYKKVYFGEVVIDELKSRGLIINELNERAVREDLRKDFGMGVMALKSIEKINSALAESNVVIESLYSWQEYKILRNEYGKAIKLLNVFTTKDIRYSRLEKRPFRPLTHAEAESRDFSELENLDKGGPIAFTDYTVFNDSTIESLNEELKKFI